LLLTGLIKKPFFLKEIRITPDLGFVVQKAPHSPILPACQAIALSTPLIIGRLAIKDASVDLPQIMISALVFIASLICSTPARPTIFVQFIIFFEEILGALLKGRKIFT
tara:strand:+ start:1908 stop:2234 length:327 start_codon:yes stop_codon:yes gene_type:complete